MGLTVDEGFEVENGLVGMQRDIVLTLCCMLFHKIRCIRVIFGMCEKHYQWRKHRRFIKSRPIYIENVRMFHQPVTDEEDETEEENSFSWSSDYKKICHFQNCISGYDPLFLGPAINGGIFSLTMEIKYLEENMDTSFFFGIAPSTAIRFFDHSHHGLILGACAFAFTRHLWNDYWSGKHDNVQFQSTLLGVKVASDYYNLPGVTAPPSAGAGGVDEWGNLLSLRHGIPFAHMVPPAPDGAVVSLEVDVYARRMCCFVNGHKAAAAVRQIPRPLHIWFVGYTHASLTFQSFRRIPTGTASAVVCREFEYLPKE